MIQNASSFCHTFHLSQERQDCSFDLVVVVGALHLCLRLAHFAQLLERIFIAEPDELGLGLERIRTSQEAGGQVSTALGDLDFRDDASGQLADIALTSKRSPF